MPPTSTFSVSKTQRLLAVAAETTLNIWRLGARAGPGGESGEEEGCEFLFLILDDYYFYLYATTLTIYFYICYFWLDDYYF